MTLRRLFARMVCAGLCFVATTTAATAAGRYNTENFAVEAPTQALAKTFGEAAEKFRREKALDWLGREMPTWPARCPLVVQVKPNETGGYTTFSFDRYRPIVTDQHMVIFGDVPRLLNSVLPHEVTHTVFAYHFGQAVPRWADEGGSVLSENDEERFEHDAKCRQHLVRGQAFRLARLFEMKDYPRDQHTLYAQGYSVCQYLVDQGGRGKFLSFVQTGMQNDGRNWDRAAQLYGFDSVDDLQVAWIKTLSDTPPLRVVARNKGTNPNPTATLASARGTETRTSPALLPLLDPPITARGVAPVAERTSGAAPHDTFPVVKLGTPEMPGR